MTPVRDRVGPSAANVQGHQQNLLKQLEYITVTLGIVYCSAQLINESFYFTAFFIFGTCVPVLYWLFNLEMSSPALSFQTFQAQTRPSGSPGLWCSVLVPLAMFLNCHSNSFECSEVNFSVSLLAFPLMASSLVWLHHVASHANNKSNVSEYNLLPLLLISTSLLYYNTNSGLFNSFIISLFLHGSFHFVLWHLLILSPKSFTIGEAITLAHGIAIFFISSSQSLLNQKTVPSFIEPPVDESILTTHFIEVSLLGVATLVFSMTFQARFRSAFSFYLIGGTIFVGFVIPTLYIFLQQEPIVWMLGYILGTSVRLMLMLFWVVSSCVAVLFAAWVGSDTKSVSTVSRKYFHLLMLLIYFPGLLYDTNFLYVVSGVTLGVFVVVECMRVLEVPPLGQFFRTIFSQLADDKDQGPLVLTHTYLLIGCSAPIWIVPKFKQANPMVVLSGLLSIGIGDTVASVFGTMFGRHRWPGTKKTVEGTFSSILAQVLVSYVLNATGLLMFPLWKTTVAVGLSALLEAFTTQVDNLVLPLYLYILLLK